MTAQLPENLIVDGQEMSLTFCPPIPARHPRIFRPDPNQAVRDERDSILNSTACWRGYQGTWEIKEGCFYLVGLRGCLQLHEAGPILADWFSGVLRVPQGEVLEYVHMGFGSIFEREIQMKVESGVVTATRVIDNRGMKRDGWEIGRENLPGGENRFPGDDE